MENPSVRANSENDHKTVWRIRSAIGYLGMSLPILLLILSLIPFFNTPVQPSISDYYYSNLREIFTGILCATGLFLIRYKGTENPSSFWKNDGLLTNIAGYMAFGIAFFPTNPECWGDKIYTLIPVSLKFLGFIHYGFAVAFFFILAMLSLKVFTIGQKDNPHIPISIFNENKIYKICGWLILAFIVMIPVFAILDVFRSATLLFEALALFSFGTSWLIKGRALGDKGKVGQRIYRESN
jgi:hypothetical protein